MPKVAHHTHKLKRHTYKTTGSKIFHCILPDCYFKIDVPMSLGKKCICWRCNKEFILNEYSIRLARPHCNSCTHLKEEIVEIKPKEELVETVNDLRDRLQKTMSSFATKEEDL